MIVKENDLGMGSAVYLEDYDACQRCNKQRDHHDAICQMRYYFENVKCVFHAFIFSCRHSGYKPENALRRVLLYLLTNGFTKEEMKTEIDNIQLGGK